MYSKQILANGFTTQRFVTQIAIIILLGGIISVSIAILGWDLRLLFVICQFVGIALFSTVSIILSRLRQFWVLLVLAVLVGLIPFILLQGYCNFQVESIACIPRSITANSYAFWFFPSITLWIPWIFAPLGKARRRYG